MTTSYPHHLSTGRTARAHLPAGGRHEPAAPQAHVAAPVYFFGDRTSELTEDLFAQYWTPGLLDRLEAPLTRYHE
jgi:hypothetical protein